MRVTLLFFILHTFWHDFYVHAHNTVPSYLNIIFELHAILVRINT